MAIYIDDNELVYEIILSKGKGFLTSNAITMLILIAKNLSTKFQYYNTIESIKEDCYQEGLMSMLINWRNFNEKKYSKALPYYSELFKRGSAFGFNKMNDKNVISIESYMEFDTI